MLSDADRELLEFELDNLRQTGPKEDAVRRRFGVSMARYYQRVNRLIDDTDALAAMPREVHLLQRLRQIRTESRASRLYRAA